MMKRSLLLAAVLTVATPVSRSVAGPETTPPATVAPVLKTYCVSCHGGTKPKADLGLDTLTADFGANGAAWKAVVDRLMDGSMPPKGKPRPSEAQLKTITDWASTGLVAYQAVKSRTEGRARLRRLNRVEYVNTIRVLLGAEVDIDALPEDGVAGGFDNVDAALDLSSTLLERYLEAADSALEHAFVKGIKPIASRKKIDMVAEAKKITNGMRPMPRYGVGTVIRDDDIVFYSEGQPDKIILDSRATSAGVYKFRVAAQAVNRDHLTFLVYSGNYGGGVNTLQTRLVSAHDISDKPGVVEFTAYLRVRDSIRLAPHGMPNLYAKPAADYKGLGMAVKWVEVEGPIVDNWPPAATVRLLGDVSLSKGTLTDAETILRRFVPRAFRRTVTDIDLAPYIGLVKSKLDKGYRFEDALKVGLKAVLCSPDFLYLSATPGKLSDFDLAARLSYFLWSNTPDDTLFDLAAKSELGKPEVLRSQVERMLKDPRAHAFTTNFTGQWLSLRKIKDTNPDRKTYPDFDDLLELSMPQETYRFFEEILGGDRPVLEFVHSDWTILNERLATLYGVPAVSGSDFRKVALPPGSHRGGVMTQAAVLKVTANGTNTSPVVRGAWVLDRMLGTPAPPPPKDVPAIEPDIRGAKTLREQLARHKEIATCAACHAKIDPPGNALENFDVIGGWRENYRIDPKSPGKRLQVQTGKGRVQPVVLGKKVEAADELPGGRKFANVDEFKKLILENPDQIARNLTEKLLVYATGHPLEFGDRATVAKLVNEIKPKNYGFRTLIHAIVQSETFRTK
jgi:mono/diheme cytochrome c family protein